MVRKTTAPLIGLACLGLMSCGQLERPGGGAPPDVSVTLRAAGGTVPTVMATCAETSGAAEVTVAASDMDGLAAIRLTFTGPVAADGVRVSPGGEDVVLTEGGLPGQRDVQVTIRPNSAGQSRNSVVLGFVTAAPHTGALNVTVTDRKGAATRSGPNRILPPGGCGG